MCTWRSCQWHQQCKTEAGLVPSVSSSRPDARPALLHVHQQAVQKLDAEVAALKSAAALVQHAASSQLDKTLDAHEQQVLALKAANNKLQLQLSELSQAVPIMLRCLSDRSALSKVALASMLTSLTCCFSALAIQLHICACPSVCTMAEQVKDIEVKRRLNLPLMPVPA